MTLPVHFTLLQVAEQLGVTIATVKRWVSSGELTVKRFGRATRVLQEDLHAFAATIGRKLPTADVSPFLTREVLIESALPRGSTVRGVYFLLLGSDVVYVGQSMNIEGRVHTHHRAAEMAFDRWWFQPCPPRLLLRLEAHYIALFKPKYNEIIKPVEEFTADELLEIAHACS